MSSLNPTNPETMAQIISWFGPIDKQHPAYPFETKKKDDSVDPKKANFVIPPDIRFHAPLVLSFENE